MKVIQHRPSFVDGFTNELVYVDSKEELLDIEFVKGFRDMPDFYRFSISDNLLMAEYENGKKWWVVAYLEDFNDIDIPKFKSNRE